MSGSFMSPTYRSSPELLPQPVGRERAVQVGKVVADMVSIVVQDELAARRLVRLALRLLPRDQAVVPACDREVWPVEPWRCLVEVQLGRLRACLPLVGRADVVLDGLAGGPRHRPPALCAIQRTAAPNRPGLARIISE